ncbi:MAG: penicillin acylase family protein [Panacagrimonas sp.]
MPLTLDQRLAAFPTDGLAVSHPVQIRWNAHAIPFIEAQTDADAAYALGLVQMHLRAAQLHVMKRLAQGRVAEMLGPLAVNLDHALRLLDLPGAARAGERSLPDPTRTWVEDFVRGLNDYQSRMVLRPPEFRWLGLMAEPWSLIDVLTLGRLAGADVNWGGYLPLLKARGKPGFSEFWRRLQIVGGTLSGSVLGRALTQFSRAGSNSVAIAARRSATGAPLMANDPHLGQSLPNFWILAGLRCPSYHMVGLMPAGLPFVGVGAGAHMAWGGTNMRAASSDLVDVSTLPDSEIETLVTPIRVRGLGTRVRRIRRTRFGPILNDARLLKVSGGAVALRWVGQEASDEIGAFLGAARASTPDEFRKAFEGFGVCAQNILFATRDGHIGHVYAARLPRRTHWPDASPVLSPAQADAAWKERWDAGSLPMTLDPASGFRVSANDRPQFTDAPLGFFFSEGDRAARLAQLADHQNLTLADLARQQRDTLTPGAATLAKALAQRLLAAGASARLIEVLQGWDGDYAADALAPVAFETLLHGLATGLRAVRGTSSEPGLDDEWGRHTRLLLPDLDGLSVAAQTELLRRSAQAALRSLGRYPRWGDMHRLRIGHLLSLIPVIGRRLQVVDWPAGGSRETPMKNAHGLVASRHDVQYGAQARHLSDLADVDANHFVLLGGNDGWIDSANYADQLPLWRDGRYLHLPLTSEAVAAEFPRLIELLPVRVQAQPATVSSRMPELRPLENS